MGNKAEDFDFFNITYLYRRLLQELKKVCDACASGIRVADLDNIYSWIDNARDCAIGLIETAEGLGLLPSIQAQDNVKCDG